MVMALLLSPKAATAIVWSSSETPGAIVLDTYISQEEPTVNFGDSEFIMIDSTPVRNLSQGLLKFQGFPPPYNNASSSNPYYKVKNATLTITSESITSSVVLFFRMKQAWSESDATYEQLPLDFLGDATTQTSLAEFMPSASLRWPGTVSNPGPDLEQVDVTADVEYWMNNEDANHGWWMAMADHVPDVWYMSSSQATQAGREPPKLVIDYEILPEPPTVVAYNYEIRIFHDENAANISYTIAELTGDGSEGAVVANKSSTDDYFFLLQTDRGFLPAGQDYSFTIRDSGDGWIYAPGGYEIWVEGNLVVQERYFANASSVTTTFTIPGDHVPTVSPTTDDDSTSDGSISTIANDAVEMSSLVFALFMLLG